MSRIDVERLRELLAYDVETGVFKHAKKSSPKSRAKVGAIVGGPRQDGYWGITFDGVLIGAHRLAWIHAYGREPEGQIDHINGDKQDNRISNLRDVTPSENKQNMRSARADNGSGLLGAHKCKGINRWKSEIRLDGKLHYLGLFMNPEDAHAAYVAAKRNLHPAGML